ncbi:hypothetical protein AMAG_17777 [Allomyces macrogynus ATCC 38327]|uniref:Uncharacterized protein n=1 Tax=Allomyces macrogynus (strain ATCC 38327) TaxID=578462 RepID=A0A0L0RZA9_ALLM3|nr:hypothetical protein AMAG_17777 [Allomyces macrogynus ATCC 38327]|eukprot:KNE55421.1 hypothetical protein AMAG_17777 [Allomyces macrogynus ATCC 38327]
MSVASSAPGTRALATLWASYANRPVIFFAATTKNYGNLKELSLREHLRNLGLSRALDLSNDRLFTRLAWQGVITHRQQKWGLVVFGDEQATTRAPGTSAAAVANALVVSDTAIERALSWTASSS